MKPIILYQAIQKTKIRNPPRPIASRPIGEELILKGLHQVVPGEFYVGRHPTAVGLPRKPLSNRSRPGLRRRVDRPSGYPRGNCFANCIGESDARTLRQFIINDVRRCWARTRPTRFMKEAGTKTRISPGNLKTKDVDRLHLTRCGSINLHDGQSMNVLRYANRVPLQFQAAGACAITQTVMSNQLAFSYGLQPGSQPVRFTRGPSTIMVHMASVWVPFTSESKEAVAAYPEIQKELRLALQSVGRKLGMFLRKRKKVKHEGERRNMFLRYLGEVAGAVSEIDGIDKQEIYDQLLLVAKKKTAEADVKMDDRGRVIEEDEMEFGDNVLIVDPEDVNEQLLARVKANAGDAEPDEQKKLF